MKIAIMQPYFLPYIGYFQLIKSVEKFIVYDNIKYTKKGWFNRNRFLLNGKDELFSLPLKHDSDSLDVRERLLSGEFDRNKLINRFKGAYKKAPHFNEIFKVLQTIVLFDETNLFKYIHFSIVEICKLLNITTEIIVSSTITIDHTLRAEEKVIALCHEMGADEYVNSIGGQELYSRDHFAINDIQLQFIMSQPVIYKQFEDKFVEWLSIIDVMMFNSVEDIQQMLQQYVLV